MTRSIIRCQSGEVTGEPCAWTGRQHETVLVEYMPEWLRASHRAAGYSGIKTTGSYPANGASRGLVCAACADMLDFIWEDGEHTDIRDPWVRRIPKQVPA